MKLIIGLIALFIATIGGIAIGFAGGILRNFDKSGITYGQLVDGMTNAVMSENPIFKTKEQAERDRKSSFDRRRKIGGPFTEFDRNYLLEVKKEVCV